MSIYMSSASPRRQAVLKKPAHSLTTDFPLQSGLKSAIISPVSFVGAVFYKNAKEIKVCKCLVSLTVSVPHIGTSFALKRNRSISKCLCVVFLLLFCCFGGVVHAAPVTNDQAAAVVAGWRKTAGQPLKAQLGTEPQTVETFADEYGKALYYVVYLAPSGFVVVPADDRIEPIICFATAGKYDPGMDNPLGALVSQDMKSRFAAIAAEADKTAGIGANADTDTGIVDIDAQAQDDQPGPTEQARGKWRYLSRLSGFSDSDDSGGSAGSSDPDDFSGYTGRVDTVDSIDTADELMTYASFDSISDVRVEPFIQSRWSQSTECEAYCYNYYTPGHYVCGCVATAMAQVLRFHQHPVEGIGVHGFEIYVDWQPQMAYTRGGDGLGGPYLWDQMVLDPDCDTTDTQRQAIGALCYDAGVSVHMMYTISSSGAYMWYSKVALVDTFDYGNAIMGYSSGDNIGAGLTDMINPNLDSGYPVLLGTNTIGEGGGHAIIADGYGYDSSTLYHHLNMGWAGVYDAWYNLPTVLTYNSIRECIYNIYVSGSGEIISGRVVDEAGEPVSDVLITAQKAGGGSYTATTNSNGIYALSKVPSASVFTVSAVKVGYDFEDQMVTTGTSLDENNTSGNRWAIDFVSVGTLAGSGTSQDPYLVQSLSDLRILAYNAAYWNDYIRLESDLDLNSQDYYAAVISRDMNVNVAGFQGTKFSGTFDGNGHKIRNMHIDPPGGDYNEDYNRSYLGLFGKTDYGATIKNLCLEDCYVAGRDYSCYVGILAGYNYKATISNCYVTGSVSGENDTYYVAGLAGFNYQANIDNCCSDCMVYVGDGSRYTGGFIGRNHSGTVRDCYAKGSVSFGEPALYIGGLAGSCVLGTIDNCYSTVNIVGTAASAGGLCGQNDQGNISDSFWDMEASDMATSYGGTGKTTAAMQDINTFLAAGWDFTGSSSEDEYFWKIPNAGGYPVFFLQQPYAGGDGSEANPYQINVHQQLLFMGRHWEYYNKYFLVTADIDLSGYLFSQAIIAPDTDPAILYFQGTKFTGSFDGGGHKITNLTINAAGTNHSFLGLFGQLNSPGLVQNLGIENVSIIAGDNAQLLGALVGYANIGSVISNCYSTGSVTAGANAIYLGGLIGANNGHIDNCYAMTNVVGATNCDYLGGLAGYNAPAAPGHIDNCYSTGIVIAEADSDYLGGLVGDNNTGSVNNSFWDTDTSGTTTSDGGEGKTTTQMQDINTFINAGWDFLGEYNNGTSDYWRMPVAGGYPILFWQQLYDGGNGSEASPYQISATGQLIFLREHPDYYSQCFILTADIDLTGYTSSPVYMFSTAVIAPDTYSLDWYFQGTPFSGVFDGNGHRITNLIIESIDGGYDYLGLFGSIDVNGVVKNLRLEDCAVNSHYDSCHIGLLAGANNGTISNCQVDDSNISCRYDCAGIGGLVGSNFGSINNCGAQVFIDGGNWPNSVGGLAGYNESGSITTCCATGNVYCDFDGWHIGGLVGYSYDGVISDCYAGGNVDGGISSELMGGLIGEVEFGSINNCYSTGQVSGSLDIGGLIGRNSWCLLDEDCFWDTETSGLTESDGGTGRTTAQMQDINTFLTAGWDFENLWRMSYKTGYPMLLWQRDISGDLAAGYGVNLADFVVFSQTWLTSAGQPGYDDDCDLVDDDTINIADLAVFAENFLQGL